VLELKPLPYPTVTRTYDGHHDFRPDLDPDVLDLEYDLASPDVQAKQLLNDHDLLGSLVYNLSELSLSSRSFSSTVISKVYRKNLFYNDTSVHYDPSGQGSSYNQSLELDHDHDEDHRSRLSRDLTCAHTSTQTRTRDPDYQSVRIYRPQELAAREVRKPVRSAILPEAKAQISTRTPLNIEQPCP